MYKVIEKNDDKVLVEMDINTYNGFEAEMEEDLSNYEFVFEKPVLASNILTNI